ncbi:hypothetical protein EA658_01960 [Pseudoxanthomonas winnipegensis]|uniref:Uncharacterized protein n=1 Tax=Pseudoxanthomonas winnipegensis TaxID=2480810 RepID=A0ABY1WI15_9GAMM|nr:hypothetical protein [Pseudoxanthomonas winnipegensis]TAA10236.1 hypothetical protein EA659_11945 [Pseudoxanthomonas winnipegensis]TAA22383.1 hypothetical protein EA658_01960 [Pseudoxanthomonas winnipegensis]TAH70145.1 hypothetical protein EA657_19355 [Pseudoxanthomonas winnipegensis]
MRRFSRMVARLYAPAPVLVAAGWVLSFVVEHQDALIGAAAARRVGSLLALTGVALGLVWASLASWRLYLWLRGMEQGRCPCGGLLSRPRHKHGQHYRKCLACGEKVPLTPVPVVGD